MIVLTNDGPREATPEEIAEYDAALADTAAQIASAQVSLAPRLYAVAVMTISEGEISGIDVASRFSAAMWLDVGFYYVFFAETLPDTSYLALAYDAASVVRVIEKTTDFIVITATDGNGVPTDPEKIEVQITRIN